MASTLLFLTGLLSAANELEIGLDGLLGHLGRFLNRLARGGGRSAPKTLKPPSGPAATDLVLALDFRLGFGGGSSDLQKQKPPLCRSFRRWS